MEGRSLARAVTMPQVLAHGTTMFDDGRYLEFIMRKAESEGSIAPWSEHGDVSPLPQRLTKIALSAKPIDTELVKGEAGGGGVRVVPTHLDLRQQR